MKRIAHLLKIFAASALLICGVLTALKGDDIEKRKSQIEQLRKEIDSYEKQIKEKEKKEKATLGLLESYDKQASLARRLIKQLHGQELQLQKDIKVTQESISGLGDQLSFLKRHYADYVATAYKFGRTYDIELVLASRSFNQMLIRSEYLKKFSNQRKKDLNRINGKRDDLEKQNALLQKQLEEQKSLIKAKEKEEKNLAAKMKKRKRVLSEIKRDKSNYSKELVRRQQDIKKLEQIIAKLIEEARAKSATENTAEGGFQSKRGRLRWPVAKGKLTARYGNQEHPTLRTITQNTGIDISVPTGTNVEAVADGEVSKIYWLPSFGNLVILNHRGGYLTVYAHLSVISVAEGDKVREGDSLGKSGETLSGSILHFEIYKGREKLNPEQWLRSQGYSQR